MSFCIIIHRNSISYAMLESVNTGYLNNGDTCKLPWHNVT